MQSAFDIAQEVIDSCTFPVPQRRLDSFTSTPEPRRSGFFLPVLVAQAREINRANPLLNLHPDILLRIFQALSSRRRAILASTCFALHDFASRRGEVWSSGMSTALGSLPTIKRLIDRSIPAPVELTVDLNWVLDPSDPDTAAHLDLISTTLPRLAHLSVVIDDRMSQWMNWFPPPSSIPRLPKPVLRSADWSALCCVLAAAEEAPILCSLTLEYNGMTDFETFTSTTSLPPLREDIFACGAPLLRSCSLRGICLPLQPCLAFSNVTTLSYQPKPAVLDVPQILSCIDSLPKLETLCMLVSDIVDAGDDSIGRRLSLSPKSMLKNLRVDGLLGNANAEALLAFLYRLGPLQQLAFNTPHPLLVVQDYAWHVERVALGVHMCEIYARIDCPPIPATLTRIRLAHPLGNIRLHDNSPNAQWFTHLTTLTIHEFYWPRRHRTAFTTAPVLKSLCIVLASCYDTRYAMQRRRSDGSLFVFQRSGLRWSCPALETVHFSYALSTRCSYHLHPDELCCCRSTLTVSLREVALFVRRGLDVPRLRSLRLSGVEVVDVDAAFWVAYVQKELADEIDVSSRTCHGPAYINEDAWYYRTLESIFSSP
ncbi:hypothetical protein EXIGLDRAFT_832437 [Exidia glandulosa HHB12029]|uniref:F-box domain-containing protein n=1 Tax=Exidia glandulosa HHB12029 TaxID=1314781 RepID=A0A165LKP2_EXIGL|nr:hypothetical protein EXIGLDRAFT_832437 [Exidia glandulosa HHB12029]